MKQMKTVLLLFLLLVQGLAGTCSYCSQKSPMDAIKTDFNDILSTLKSESFQAKSDTEQNRAIYEKLANRFDFKTMSMLVLGRNWKRFSPKQQEAFALLFSKLITKVYFSKIKGQNLDDVGVDYIKTIQLQTKSERADVHTLLYHNKVETPVVYRMLKKKSGQWMVYDVNVEGLSLLVEYRRSYKNRVMVSPETIINELKEKVERWL